MVSTLVIFGKTLVHFLVYFGYFFYLGNLNQTKKIFFYQKKRNTNHISAFRNQNIQKSQLKQILSHQNRPKIETKHYPKKIYFSQNRTQTSLLW